MSINKKSIRGYKRNRDNWDSEREDALLWLKKSTEDYEEKYFAVFGFVPGDWGYSHLAMMTHYLFTSGERADCVCKSISRQLKKRGVDSYALQELRTLGLKVASDFKNSKH